MTLAEEAECGWLDGLVEDVLDHCIPNKIMKVAPTTQHHHGRALIEDNLCGTDALLIPAGH